MAFESTMTLKTYVAKTGPEGHFQSSLYVTLICISAYINKVANTNPPLLRFMNSMSHTCAQPKQSFTVMSMFLWETCSQPDPKFDKHLAGRARRLTFVVTGTGLRQERGLLNQPAIQRPFINPLNGLGCGT